MDGPIASAVVLPDELVLPASPPTSLKRRQSSISEDNAKRARHDDDEEATARQESTNGDKPAAPVRRERGRERRLFGAVLGALSQNPTTPAQKRRTEIEKRQLAQRKLEDEESEQRKAERAARRRAQREKEQRQFEYQKMRLRHDNLLDMAHFLKTEAKPHLYYKPWETSPEEQDRIRDQIADAHEIIERELQEHEACQRQDAQRDRHAPASRDADGSHVGKRHNAIAPEEPSTSNGGTNASAHSPKDLDMTDDHAEGPKAVSDEHIAAPEQDMDQPSHETPADESSKDEEDENGEDIVEEAAEDTVIY